jgi:hypothetical protein
MTPDLTGDMSSLPATTTTLRLFNTLSGQVDELIPSDGKEVRMYACGPTVYDYGHIGNFRTFLEIDVLRRFLKLTGMRTIRSFGTRRQRVSRSASIRRSTWMRFLKIWMRSE